MRSIVLACALVLFAAPALAADRVVTLAPDNQFAGAVRLGASTEGPTVRDAVPPDIADLVFPATDGPQPIQGWFTRTYKASLKTNGMLAKKPETARYELTADIADIAIVPTPTGSTHKSQVTFRLRRLADDTIVWEQPQQTDKIVARGIRFGKIGGAIGGAVGGAITGQNSAVTAAQITASQGRIRPFDISIDVYEGIMKGFQDMAEKTVIAMAALPSPLPPFTPSAPATAPVAAARPPA